MFRTQAQLKTLTKVFDKRLTAFQRVSARFGLSKKPNSLTVEIEKLKVLSEMKGTLIGILDVMRYTVYKHAPCI